MAKKDGNFWIDKKGEAVHQGNVPEADKRKDKLVENLITSAQALSCTITEFKENAMAEVDQYFNELLEVYKIDAKSRSKKGNITLENFSGTEKIEITVADRIAFDEKLQIAKKKLDECLHELTKHSPAAIKTLITKAFDVDSKGAVSPKKIFALKAYDIDHPKWLEAMKIIDDATEVVSSKSYIRFYARNNIEEGYELIQLNISGA